MPQPSPAGAQRRKKKTKAGKRRSSDHVEASSAAPEEEASAAASPAAPAKRAKHGRAPRAPLPKAEEKAGAAAKRQTEEEQQQQQQQQGSEDGHSDDDASSLRGSEGPAGSEASAGSADRAGALPGEDAGRRRVDVSKLSPAELEAHRQAQARRGVVYISRVPPFMRPVKLRHLLGHYGEIDRIWLRPEDEAARKKRLRKGGSRKRNYCEGWVEFLDKKVARSVAASLNATPIGGKKGNFHYEDLWTLRYLPKFKWHNLTERVAYDRAVREKRIQAEMQQVQKESLLYVEQVNKAQR